MLRYGLLIVLFCNILVTTYTQIPNGGFELWETAGNFEKPIGWHVNQDSIYERFQKDSISVEGNYSLKIIPGAFSSWEGCNSRAFIRANFNSALPPNSALIFYVKSIPVHPEQDENVYLIIQVFAWDSNEVVNSYDWRTFSSVEDFTKVKIPLPDENINGLSILIFGGASTHPADGPCLSRSYTWIDGLYVDTGLPEDDVVIYPNPSDGNIQIHYPGAKHIAYELYSLLGQLISKGEVVNRQLTIDEKGVYALRLRANIHGGYVDFSTFLLVD